MNEIILTGCVPEFNQIGLTRLLMDKANMQLHEAKRSSDSVLESKTVNIKIESYELAEYILAEAIKSGAMGELVKGE
jgi:hypothetical protein